MITDGVYQYLSSNATIKAAVGSRIYAGRLPQKPGFPCILSTIVSSEPVARLSEGADLYRTHFQFDIFSPDYEIARTIAKSLQDVFEDEKFPVSMGSHVVRQVSVIDAGKDFYDDVPDDYRVIAEYELWHTN